MKTRAAVGDIMSVHVCLEGIMDRQAVMWKPARKDCCVWVI